MQHKNSNKVYNRLALLKHRSTNNLLITKVRQHQDNPILNQLSIENSKISNYCLLKYHSRSLSSESKLEGTLNKKTQQIFSNFPYHCCRYIQKERIKKLWRKYIFVIISLFRYGRARYDLYKFYIPKRKLFVLPTPETLIKSPRKRKEQSLMKLSTFGEYLEAQDQIETTKRKDEKNQKKSLVYLDYKKNDLRISRILKIRNLSLNEAGKISPQKIKKLPPLIKLDRRLQRVLSNQIKQYQ